MLGLRAPPRLSRHPRLRAAIRQGQVAVFGGNVRWQCLAQTLQGQEVETLRKDPQSSMAAAKRRERWQCLAQAR